MTNVKNNCEPMQWDGGTDGKLVLIDQTRLPTELTTVTCDDVESAWEAIRALRVRGAPAIGITAAYAVILGLQTVPDTDRELFFRRLSEVCDYLGTSRPTAVNLFWALDRMKATGEAQRDSRSIAEARLTLLNEARAIHNEDRRICRTIGRHAATLLDDDCGVLTHCNAGGLATSEYGTALSAFFTAQDQGKTVHVFVDETRPLLQGARLTTWELQQRGIHATLICDSMAAQVMKEGRVSAVITGADRVANNGDAANKIGTYGLAILANAHKIPFYIAAPVSTFDRQLHSGETIPIEHRPKHEITHGLGKQTAPDGIDVYNPAFDVTPAALITAIITERGIIQPVTTEQIASVIGSDL